jgi:hypothetical protein
MYQSRANVKELIENSAIDAIPIDVSTEDYESTTPARAIMIGTTGDLDITTVSGNRRLLLEVPVGVHSIGINAVHTAGTTAANITLLV